MVKEFNSDRISLAPFAKINQPEHNGYRRRHLDFSHNKIYFDLFDLTSAAGFRLSAEPQNNKF